MWDNPKKTAGLVTFTEEILNKKLHFLCSDSCLATENKFNPIQRFLRKSEGNLHNNYLKPALWEKQEEWKLKKKLLTSNKVS